MAPAGSTLGVEMTIGRRVGLIVLVVAMLVIGLMGLAPVWLPLGLRFAGIDNVAFETLDIGLTGTEIRAVGIGAPAGLTIDRVQVDYTPFGLIRGRIDRITLSGLEVAAALADGGLRLAGVDAKQGGGALPMSTALLADRIVLRDGRVKLATPRGLATLPLSGSLRSIDDQAVFELVIDGADIRAGEGNIRAEFRMEGRFAVDQTPALDRVGATGTLVIAAANADLPGIGGGLAGGGMIAFDLAQGEIEASSDGLAFDAEWLSFGDRRLSGPWRAVLGRRDRPLRLSARQDGEAWRIAVDGLLGLGGRMGDAELDLDMRGLLDRRGGLRSLERAEVSLLLTDLAWQDLALTTGRADLALHGARGGFQGSLDLDLVGLNWSAAPLMIVDAALKQSLALTLDDDALTVWLTEAGRMSLGRVSVGDDLESGWFTVRLRPGDAPLLRLMRDQGLWRYALDAEIDPVRLETAAGRLWGRIEKLTLSAAGDPGGLDRGRIAIGRGRLDLPGANLAVTGIRSDIRLDADGLVADRPIPLKVRALRPLDRPRWFTPLRLDATLRPEPARFSFDGRLVARTRPTAGIDLAGRHDLDTGRGLLRIDLAPITFEPGGLQPDDLSPALTGVLDQVKGTLALAGDIAWRPGDMSSDVELLIEEVGLLIGPARLERVNGVIRFDQVAPLATPADQQLAVGLLDVGLPFTDGLVSMRLGTDGDLAVDRLTWRLAGGQIRAEPFSFGSDVRDLTMILKADQLDLDELLGLTRLDGLSGEGRIDGVLPLTIGAAGAAINGGELEATGPGFLRYRPNEVPRALQAGGESVRLMLQALENFRYDALRITLDGRTDGAADIGFHVSGANPELYDGHPVEFNLDLEGNLATLIRTNLSNYRIPDRIREHIQGFKR